MYVYELRFPCFYFYYFLRRSEGENSLIVGVGDNYEDLSLNDLSIASFQSGYLKIKTKER